MNGLILWFFDRPNVAVMYVILCIREGFGFKSCLVHPYSELVLLHYSWVKISFQFIPHPRPQPLTSNLFPVYFPSFYHSAFYNLRYWVNLRLKHRQLNKTKRIICDAGRERLHDWLIWLKWCDVKWPLSCGVAGFSSAFGVTTCSLARNEVSDFQAKTGFYFYIGSAISSPWVSLVSISVYKCFFPPAWTICVRPSVRLPLR
jgi:hypothetical protein